MWGGAEADIHGARQQSWMLTPILASHPAGIHPARGSERNRDMFVSVFFFVAVCFFHHSGCLPEHLTQVLDDLKQKRFHFIPPDTRAQIRRTALTFAQHR